MAEVQQEGVTLEARRGGARSALVQAVIERLVATVAARSQAVGAA